MPSGASWMLLLPGSPCPAQAFLAPEPGRQPLLLTSLCQRPDCVLGLGWGRTGCFLSLQDIVTLLACDHSFQGLILFLNWAQCQDFNRSSAQTGAVQAESASPLAPEWCLVGAGAGLPLPPCCFQASSLPAHRQGGPTTPQCCPGPAPGVQAYLLFCVSLAGARDCSVNQVQEGPANT